MGKRKRGKGNTAAGAVATAVEPALAFRFGRAWLAPVLAFVALLALYVLTLAPSVAGGDSGELTAAALTGGVPHPPGYPLFALLARLFAALPLGHSPAWRVNLVSALATAGAGGLLCAAVQRWTRDAAAGLVAAALFGTSLVAWRHATAAEVFGLNALFVACALWLWIGIERAADAAPVRRRVLALGFVCGLAMSNHHTFVFVGGPLALRSLWLTRRQLGWKGVGATVGLAIAGLAPYLYLYVASRSHAAVSWGDQTTLDGWLGHILRRTYGTFRMGRAHSSGPFLEEGTFFVTMWRMLGYAWPRLLWLGVPLAGVGLYAGLRARHQRGPVAWVGGILAGYVVVFAALSNLAMDRELYVTVLSRFCLQSDLLLALAAGLGFAWLSARLRARFAVLVRHAHWAPVAALAIFGLGVALHGRECNERGNRVFADFVTTAFASLPPNAMVITMGDHLTGSVFYFHEVEKLRPDVIHLDRELLGFTWYGDHQRRLHPDFTLPAGHYGRNGWKIKDLLDGNPGRPLVVIDRLETWDESWKDGYKLATNGLVHPLVPAAQFPTYAQWSERDRAALGQYDVMPALTARLGSWERTLGQMVMSTQAGRGHLALLYSTDAHNLPGPARHAVALLEDVIAKAGGDAALGIPRYPGAPTMTVGAGVFKDLGIGYEVLSLVDPSFRPRVAVAFEKFVERAEPTDKDLATARHYVEQHRPRR